jgi:hypothetical protein
MANPSNKLTVVLDFDGVLHSYTSGWQGVDQIKDPPVTGAIEFLREAVKHFNVNISSTRSHDDRGKRAMQSWLAYWVAKEYDNDKKELAWLAEIEWPTIKPPAFVTIDDRAITFTGIFPSMEQIMSFKPWYKK